jgi:hypothetical protein
MCVSCEVRTGFYIPEDGILHSHCRENLKSYIALFCVSPILLTFIPVRN